MKFVRLFYEIAMFFLVLITIISLWNPHSYFNEISAFVWFIFFMDFLIRLSFSKDKWGFIKENPFLVVAIIPLDQFFQVSRIVHIFYLFRIKTLTKFHIKPFLERFSISSKIRLALLLSLFLFVESILLYFMEPALSSFGESILCSISFLFFFGHQYFVLETPFSSIFLVLNSIIGIVIHGFVVQWLFYKIGEFYQKIKKNPE